MQRLAEHLNQISQLCDVLTFVEIIKAAFPVFAPINCRAVRFNNLELQNICQITRMTYLGFFVQQKSLPPPQKRKMQWNRNEKNFIL